MRRKCQYQNEYYHRKTIGESDDVWYDGLIALETCKACEKVEQDGGTK